MRVYPPHHHTHTHPPLSPPSTITHTQTTCTHTHTSKRTPRDESPVGDDELKMNASNHRCLVSEACAPARAADASRRIMHGGASDQAHALRGGADVDKSPHHAGGGRRPAGALRGARARVFACVSHIILALDLRHFSQRGARPANASTPLRPIALPLQGARSHSFSAARTPSGRSERAHACASA